MKIKTAGISLGLGLLLFAWNRAKAQSTDEQFSRQLNNKGAQSVQEARASKATDLSSLQSQVERFSGQFHIVSCKTRFCSGGCTETPEVQFMKWDTVQVALDPQGALVVSGQDTKETEWHHVVDFDLAHPDYHYKSGPNADCMGLLGALTCTISRETNYVKEKSTVRIKGDSIARQDKYGSDRHWWILSLSKDHPEQLTYTAGTRMYQDKTDEQCVLSRN